MGKKSSGSWGPFPGACHAWYWPILPLQTLESFECSSVILADSMVLSTVFDADPVALQ